MIEVIFLRQIKKSIWFHILNNLTTINSSSPQFVAQPRTCLINKSPGQLFNFSSPSQMVLLQKRWVISIQAKILVISANVDFVSLRHCKFYGLYFYLIFIFLNMSQVAAKEERFQDGEKYHHYNFCTPPFYQCNLCFTSPLLFLLMPRPGVVGVVQGQCI